MANNSSQNITENKPSLFTPSVVRNIKNQIANNAEYKVTYGEVVADSNIESSNSIKFALPGEGIKSTQQLNIDWNKFENHTFFNSAQVKTNVAFDKIINEYPFDGSQKEVENYFDNLTGFEKWIYDNYPKYKGYLFFSGTNVGEPSGGTYITVKDIAGASYPSVSRTTNGSQVLNPGNKSLTIEFYLFVPAKANTEQVILDKHIESGVNKQGFYIGLQNEVLTTHTSMSFYVMSGTVMDSLTVGVEKGSWNHFTFIWDRTPGVYKSFVYKNGIFQNSSSYGVEFQEMYASQPDLLIGSGSTLTGFFTPQTTFSGALDELRIWHTVRNLTDINEYMQKSIFAKENLKLYYKLNEPANINSALVIDHSSNSLHGKLSNSAIALKVREVSTGSIAGSTPMIYEKLEFSPVLFPSYPEVGNMRYELLYSGSIYDQKNPNLITKLIPPHYLYEGQIESALETEEGEIVTTLQGGTDPRSVKLGATQTLLLLLYTWAKFFDEMKLFIQAFADINFIDYDETDTVPDQFLLQFAKNYGIDLPPLFSGASIGQFLNAENIQDDISTNTLSLQYIQNQIWRRILNNLQDVIQSKGTIHSVKAFIRSVGIDPDNNFRIREYGGPTKRSLSFVRDNRSEVSTALSFISGGLLTSPFLSASRIEPGIPIPTGTSNDELFTSGSWTYEATYLFSKDKKYQSLQSLLRLNTTGSSLSGNEVWGNLVFVSGTNNGTLNAFLRPNTNSSSPVLTMTLTGVDLFDGNQWYVSLGRTRNDLFPPDTISIVSSSYFLRAGKQNFGSILQLAQTSSYFDESIGGGANIQQVLNANFNASGSYFTVGSQSIDTTLPAFLNASMISNPVHGVTDFNGKITQIRFWTKSITEKEWKEHVLDYKSVGVQDPSTNFNFITNKSGSWERLRIDASTDQIDLETDSAGNISIFDFTQNNFHLSGTSFPATSSIINPERFYYSYISPKFDEASTVDKVRVRSFQEFENVQLYPWAEVAPVYQLVPSELPTDNTRFTIDFSVIDALDQDIITIFSTLDSLDNVLGSPELLFSPDYPGLANLREIYFNKLVDKINIKNFFEFFKWFDTNIGTFVAQLIPRKTKFLGTNFVIQSHMLERPKMEYLYNEIYLGDSNRDALRSVILLQLFTGTFVKY